MRTLAYRSAPPGDQLAVVRDIADRLGLIDVSDRARETADVLAGAPLGVAVVGQFKAGKSSLLNSLLGRDLLPVRAIPATSVVTTVRHRDTEQVTVRFTSGASVAIASDELADYVTEQRNPDNRRGVQVVEVGTRALADFPDLVFVDTPGLGSVYDLSTAASTDWLPHVGVAVLAVPATQPLAAADIDLVGRVTAHTPHVLVVVTKADLVAPEDLAEVLDFVASGLSERTGHNLTVLPYSTAPGYQDARAELRAALRGLQEHHAQTSAELAAHRTARLVEECRGYLRLALAAADADAEAREGLRHALEEEQSRSHRLLGEALTLVHPYNERIESTLVAHAERRAPVVAERVRTALAARLADERGSLAAETTWVSTWLSQTLSVELAPEARAAADLAAPILQEARGPFDGLGQAFAQRLSGHVNRALGIDFDPPAVAPPTPEPEPVDVAVGAVFDSHLELASWLVPMALVRPLVHRHFRRLVRWQVEKNVLRVGYSAAASATGALDRLAAEYAAAISAQVAVCGRLVSTMSDEASVLRQAMVDLETGEGAA